ncbi:MAG: glycosyltransferase family 1 protein, partial [Eubacterium sp.]|nr:glycosyltransferase family 1 protein [Eubacterium sp.]
DRLLSQTSWTLEQAVETCLKEKGLILPEEDLRDTIRLFQDMDGMLRSQVRANVVKTLADNDIKVHIYGEGWQFLDCKQENLILHDRIPFDETIPLIADAKIVLNVMPWFKSGVHDRVYSAMLNECACLTDSSEYMNRTLTDGEQAIFYSLEHLEELPDRVKGYLREPEKLKWIAHNGYEYAKDTQTWQYRAKQLLEIMEKCG